MVQVSTAVAALLLAWSSLAVLRFPHRLLWTSTIAATEFGHFIALLALGVAVWAWSAGAWPGVGLALAAAALFLSPHVRASALDAGYTPAGLMEMQAPAEGDVTTHTYPAADGSELQLDLYPGPGAGPHPLMVSIHGGSWSGGDRTQLAGFNRHLAQLGYSVAAISYRLAPGHVWPAQRDDVEAAIRWLREHASELGLDATRVVLFGRSAGAHLAMDAGLRAGRGGIAAILAFYGPADLVWGWHHPGPRRVYDTHGTMLQFLGAPYDEMPERYADASPLNRVSADAPPTLIVHGERDELVSLTHARKMQAAMSEAGAALDVVVLPWATHGFDANPAGPGGQIALLAMRRFLEAHGR